MNRIAQLDSTRANGKNCVKHVAHTVADFPEIKPGNGHATAGRACA